MLTWSAPFNVCIRHCEANNRYFNFGNVGGESLFDVNISIAMFRLDDLKFIKQYQKHLWAHEVFFKIQVAR